jgi:hypothetical protein
VTLALTGRVEVTSHAIRIGVRLYQRMLSVAFNGPRIIVGAPLHANDGVPGGAAYVFVER